MAERTGLAAIADELGAGDDLAAASQAEQLDLLGLSIHDGAVRSRGRPQGSRNLRNQRIAGYLLTKYRDPLEGLVAMAGLGVDELAAALGCSKAEAWAEKRLCAVAAIPYLHQRQPLAVDLTGRQVVHLTITDSLPDAPDHAGISEVLGRIIDVEENQRLSDGEGGDV